MKHLYAFLLFAISLFTANAQLTSTSLPPYAICETNSDGFAQFNLKEFVTHALSIEPSLYMVNFYMDAALNVAVQNPDTYVNIASHETIYFRITEIANSTNTVVNTLDLYVENGAIANTPAPIILCDDSTPNDGIRTFDLTIRNNQITGGCTNCLVEYYLTEDIFGTPISNPQSFRNTSSPQTIYVKVKSTGTISGCFATTALELNVLPLPNDVTLPEIIACGNNIFNLTLNNSLYGTGINVSYHTTQADALAGANSINTPTAYLLPASSRSVWVRAGAANCFIIKQQTLTSYTTNFPHITFSIIGNIVTFNAGNGEFLYSIDGIAKDQKSNIFNNVPYGENTVSVTDNCGNMMVIPIMVINISAPTGSNIQTFTDGQTLADLTVTGQNITWYTTAAGFTVLPKETLLTDGTTYYAAQTIDNNQSANRLAVTAKKTLGIDDLQANKLTYYPNPVTEIFTINNSANITAVTIYNTLGQAVINQKPNSTIVQLNLQMLTSGIYIIKATSGLNTQSFKIVKR